MIQCSRCGKELEGAERITPVASISGSIMGDEYTESYFFCPVCQVYTVEILHDRFAGETSVSIRGPVPKSQGDIQVQVIQRCLEPWDKKCRCPAHREYFGNSLD